jgi:hypothetical protein
MGMKTLGSYVEKEMGINQFSIYASFVSKQGLFLESLKCYKPKLTACSKSLKRYKRNQRYQNFLWFGSNSIEIVIIKDVS